MYRDEWIYVGHMLEMGQQALEISANKNKVDYDNEITLRLALTHAVQVIEDPAQRVSEQFRDGHPEVRWREIISMRHRIVYDYLNR